MTKALKVTLLAGAALVIVYAALRLGFYAANQAFFGDVPASEILGAFLHGLRFDVAGLLLLNLPILVLYHVPLPTIKPRWYLWIVGGLFCASNAVGLLVNVFDFGYYEHVQRRTSFEPLSQPGNRLQDIGGWFDEYTTLFVFGLAGVLLATALLAWFVRRLQRRIPETPGGVRSHVCAVLLIGVGVIGVRGGLQRGIMRPPDAFVHSPSYAVGNMTLNSTYTVIWSALLPRYAAVRLMGESEAFRIATEFLVEPGEERLDPRYPFARRRTSEGEPNRRNVIVFILESWTAEAVGPDAQGTSRTPFFDSLANQGVHFTNFLASGQRSAEAVPAILASLPSLFARPLIGTQSEMAHFRGLGDILGAFGYQSTFHYGALPRVEGFHGFAGMLGFDRSFSLDDYRGAVDANSFTGRHGIFDELYYVDSAKRIDELQPPFASVIFGLTPHDPFRLPPDRRQLFAAYAHETPYQQMMRYSDFSLRRFFEYARSRPWYDNTVFLFTADHTRFSPPESFYGAFHVPFLIYGPGHVQPAVRGELASHVDILPTLLDLLDVPAGHASMGRSVFASAGGRYSVVQRGGRYVIFDDQHAYMHDLRRSLGLFDYRKDPRFRRDLAQDDPAAVERLRKKLFAYVQAVTTTVADDRVWSPGR